MRLRNIMTLMAVAACTAAVHAESPSSVEFRYAPKTGQEIRHQLVMNSVGTMTAGPGAPGARFTQSTTQEIAGVCREVNPDGSAVFDMALTRIATRMNMPGMRLDYDSRTFDPLKTDNAVVRMIGRLYSGLVGSKLGVTFNAHGMPIKVTGMHDAVLKAIEPLKKELAKDPVGLIINPLIDNLAAAFDDSMINDQLKSFYRFIPTDESGPVPVGKKWSSDWDMELPFLKTTCKAKGQYELLGVETIRGHACAKIAIKESFAMNTNPKRADKVGTKPAQGMARLFEKMDMSLSASDGDGVAYWDYERGVMVQLRQTQRIMINVKFNPKDIMAMSAPASETAPAGQQTVQTMTQNLTTSIQVDLLEGQTDQTTTGKATSLPTVR